MFAAWLLGGVISLIGALCYAELATAYPHAGGDYHFLRRAYGRSVAFLFGWARFSVITTGSIALLAFVFGDYMQQVLPLGVRGAAVGRRDLRGAGRRRCCGGSTRAASGPAPRRRTGSPALEVGGLLLIVVAALWLLGGRRGRAGAAAAAPAGAARRRRVRPGDGVRAAHLRRLERGRLHQRRAARTAAATWCARWCCRSLLITALYLLVTWAYWRGLGLEGMAKSEALAADLLRVAFGPVGRQADRASWWRSPRSPRSTPP